LGSVCRNPKMSGIVLAQLEEIDLLYQVTYSKQFLEIKLSIHFCTYDIAWRTLGSTLLNVSFCFLHQLEHYRGTGLQSPLLKTVSTLSRERWVSSVGPAASIFRENACTN
jgi:hypothetical protein